MTIHTKIAIMALLSLCAACCVPQSAAAYDGVLTLTVENDTWTGSDSNYTNGVGILWVSSALDSYDDENFGGIGVWPHTAFLCDTAVSR